MHASIWLKFGIHIRSLKENTRINFGVNLINIKGIISDFMHKVNTNFCHAYRVNCFKELPENRYLAKLNIRKVCFGGNKLIE